MTDFVDTFTLSPEIYTTYKVSYIEHGEVHIEGQSFVKNTKGGHDYPIGDPQHAVMPLELIGHIVQNKPIGNF
jgi:hypothetical protein